MLKIPNHIAIIMDGNGRWSKAHGLPKFEGHRQGVNAVRNVVRHCVELKVQTLTLFAFSTENNKRTEEEVGWLFKLFLATLRREVKKLHEANICLEVIGDLSIFNDKLQKTITDSVALLANNTGMKLVVAANYGGQWDIAQAAKKIAQECVDSNTNPEEINERYFAKYLSLGSNPIDLMIRSSGEQRISNFMLWQLAYSELYFTDTLWPDFDSEELDFAIENYQNRDRRFGKKH